MTSQRQLREMIAADPRYAHLKHEIIDWAIYWIRQSRKAQADYNRINNRQFEYVDDERMHE